MSVRARHGRGIRRDRGLATVEFAIALPLLLLMMLSTAELGRLFVQSSTLAHAVRDSARYVAGRAIAGNRGVIDLNQVDRVNGGTVLANATRLLVYGNVQGSGTPRLPGLQNPSLTTITIQAVGTQDVIVRASYLYQPMVANRIPGFGFGADVNVRLPLNTEVVMRAL